MASEPRYLRPLHKARLALALTVAPVLAVAMQSLAYADVPWACASGRPGLLHVIPPVFVVLCAASVLDAFLLWRGSRAATSDGAEPADRTRFVALTGLMVSSASLLLIVAMWVPLFVFDPCMR